MPVAVEDVLSVIKENYTARAETADDNHVIFALMCGTHAAHVSLHLVSAARGQMGRQKISISFVFCDSKYREYTFNHLEDGIVTKAINAQLARIDYGSINLQEEDGGKKIIFLYRMVEATENDLCLAMAGSHESQLHDALVELTYEFELIAPAILSLVDMEQTTEYQMNMLLDHSTEKADA